MILQRLMAFVFTCQNEAAIKHHPREPLEDEKAFDRV